MPNDKSQSACPFHDTELSSPTRRGSTARDESPSCSRNMSNNPSIGLDKVCSEVDVPHKIIHEVRDDSQLAYLQGIDVLLKKSS